MQAQPAQQVLAVANTAYEKDRVAEWRAGAIKVGFQQARGVSTGNRPSRRMLDGFAHTGNYANNTNYADLAAVGLQ
ncbi:MAG: hypothetical protein U0Y68_24215 [Blastocatellia bacterium]